jgi:cellulose biosynthesis protein BcsQ
MTRIIGSYAIKGGVGKTATVVNLAYLAASEGAHTLIWDLDPQGAVSFYFRVQPGRRGGIKRLLRGGDALRSAIRSTDYANLDLLPADTSHRKVERLLHRSDKPHKLIGSRLKGLDEHYDYVFLDCPAGMSLLHESVLRHLDALVVPLIPTTLSLRTYSQLLEMLERVPHGAETLELMPFFSMCDRRKRMHSEIMAGVLSGGAPPLSSAVPYAVEVERMGNKRMPVDRFAGTSDAAVAYRALWGEIKERMAKGR